MSWDEAIVKVSAGGGSGTGCFISPRTILTAGHVLYPSDQATPFEASEVSIQLGQRSWTAQALRIHPLWLASRSRSADMAVIVVTSAGVESLECTLDFDPSPSTRLALNGFALNTAFENQVGAFTRLGEPTERYFLHSTDVNVVDGLSGAPLLRGKSRPKVVGIAVWGDGAIGLGVPLLRSTFNEISTRKKT
jgi:V8-like Glu-specific endopeptidase